MNISLQCSISQGLCALGRRLRLKLKWTEIIQVVVQPALDGRMPDFSNPDPTPLTAISKTDIHISHAPIAKAALQTFLLS
jgi:hypothetical protein